MNIAKKREAGAILGRKGIAEEIIRICKKVADEEHYKNAVNAAGQISVLFQACTYDQYWSEKATAGQLRMEEQLQYMIEQVNINSEGVK